MSQYYKYAAKVGENSYQGFSPWVFNDFLKETEHAYIRNRTVSFFYLLLADSSLAKEFSKTFLLPGAFSPGAWSGLPVYHAGDYQNSVPGLGENIYDHISDGEYEDFKVKELLNYLLSSANLQSNSGRLTDSALDDFGRLVTEKVFSGKPLFIVNHDKKTYIDARYNLFVRKVTNNPTFDPLSLLIATTDHRDGADYHGVTDEMNELHGSWSGDRISTSRKRPGESFSELKIIFEEHGRNVHSDTYLRALGEVYAQVGSTIKSFNDCLKKVPLRHKVILDEGKDQFKAKLDEQSSQVTSSWF